MHRAGQRKLKRLVLWLSVLAGVVLLFYALVGYFGSADMFGDHPRWRGMNRGPADFGLKGETVAFASQDGIPLKAWWLPAEGTGHAVVIIAHGIDHTRQVMLPRAAFLVHGGYDVLALDLRGHGESGGSAVSPGLLEARDILGAIRYVRSQGDSEPVVLLGLSYGAAASLIAAAQSSEVKAVVSDGAFTSGKILSEDISEHMVHDSHANLLVRALFAVSLCPGAAGATSLVYRLRSGVDLGPDLLSVKSYASGVKVPVLLISGGRDWIVPTARARELFAAIPGNGKSLVVIPDAVHDTTYSTAPAIYANAVLSFLGSALKAHASPFVNAGASGSER